MKKLTQINFPLAIIKASLFIFRCILLVFSSLESFHGIKELLEAIPHHLIILIEVALEGLEKILRFQKIRKR